MERREGKGELEGKEGAQGGNPRLYSHPRQAAKLEDTPLRTVRRAGCCRARSNSRQPGREVFRPIELSRMMAYPMSTLVPMIAASHVRLLNN